LFKINHCFKICQGRSAVRIVADLKVFGLGDWSLLMMKPSFIDREKVQKGEGSFGEPSPK
jgi:hypothetical protein